MLSEIDSEIAKLQHARVVLLTLSVTSTSTDKRRGRPKGSGKKTVASPKPKKRTLTAAGRKRIADDMKRRWAIKKAVKKAPPARAIELQKDQTAAKKSA